MGLTFVLDTSAYSDFNRGYENLRKWFVPVNQIIVPYIVIGEIRACFIVGNKRVENERLLKKFLDFQILKV